MNDYRQAARPVLFESDDTKFSYFGLGSSVLLSKKRCCYWVTACHVLDRQGQRAETLRVFPSDSSRMSIPFDLWIRLDSDPENPDHTDLYVLQVDRKSFDQSGDAELVTQRVEDGFLDASRLRAGDELLIVGFPGENRAVDYDDFKISYQRSDFVAQYVGSGPMKYCHRLRFADDHGLATFNGLSGAPVYRLLQVGDCVLPALVGILLRGTASSRLGHFVGAEVLRYVINKAEFATAGV